MQVTVTVSWKWHLFVFNLETGLKLVKLGELVLSRVRIESLKLLIFLSVSCINTDYEKGKKSIFT